MIIRTAIGIGCVVVATVLLILRARQTRGRWRNARAWALWFAVFFFALAEMFSVPSNGLWLRDVTGIPNVARILTYLCVPSTAVSFLALALTWRHPEDIARTKVRRLLTLHGAVATAAVVLFAMSSVPEERPTDFPTHYATEPTIVAMATLIVTMTLTCFVLLAYWCFSWAASEDFADLPWLRLGLRLYGAVGVTFAIWLSIAMLLIIAANWTDSDALGGVYRYVSNLLPLVAVVLLAGALLIPVWGRRAPAVRIWVERWRAFRVLRSLHRVLQPVAPANVVVTRGKSRNPHHRVRRMMIELNDWRTTLSPLFDPEVRRVAQEYGEASGLPPEQVEALIEAAQLHRAVDAWRCGVRPPSVAGSVSDEDIRDGRGSIDTELAWWLRVAQAYRGRKGSPAFAAVGAYNRIG